MKKTMSLVARKELLLSFKESYHLASWLDKSKALDGFVAVSGYERKYAIRLLNSPIKPPTQKTSRSSRIVYDEQVKLVRILAHREHLFRRNVNTHTDPL